MSYNSNPLSYLSPEYRKPFYFVYAVAGLILGCLELVLVDATWTATALAVYALVGTATGAVAGINTPTREKAVEGGGELHGSE